MRKILIALLFGVGIPLALLAIAWVFDPTVPLVIPLGPGFLLQSVARRLGFVSANRALFWLTPLGWALLAYLVLSLRPVVRQAAR